MTYAETRRDEYDDNNRLMRTVTGGGQHVDDYTYTNPAGRRRIWQTVRDLVARCQEAQKVGAVQSS